MKKGTAAAILMAAAMSLSGCSFVRLDAQTLMQAPKPTGESESDIQSLLEKTAGTQFTLKYPVSGQYRSAILEHDLSGDNVGEAIAFYRKSTETEGTSVVFMQKKDGAWKVVGTFANQSAQVDRVCFGDLDGDGKDDAVVGWGSSLNNNASVCAYFLRDGKMAEQRLSLNYTDLEVMDFTGDGRSEIFTASVTEGSQPAEARLTRVDGTDMETLGSAPMDTGVTRYASVRTGLLNEKQRGVVLDGVKASSVTVTELLYWDAQQKALVSPFYDESTKTVKSTARTTSVRSKDINGDTIIEIPIVSLMPGYSDGTADEADCLTSWQRYDTQNNTFIRVMTMVINYADGYYVSIPDMWRGKITTKMDPATRSFTFYQWMQSSQDAAGVLGPQLLRIEVFTKKEWSAKSGTAGYFELAEKSNLVFAASLPSASNSLSLTAQEVKEAFCLIESDS